ncbi:YhdP family phospholipid transporter [Ferrovum myxofaciens]|uniref:YhdP central domain-containing protein n=2 Tax=Ferrovum myxofaciens TaxID=416213 RepID=A0A9E6N0M4_9PROT|nr:DUF3971 domain-containing protein [Ferrovum myxofaciens]MBU6994149.1 hypothetical protein [Ferrovum myxofaciens]QKE38088.2 MAG: hypothetical protein HO273_04615 [Ferrovum myxofaciens]QKE40665.1 MAG: hypothetical protein HO274_04645 [Ferrovum myxofaciens]QWY78540.1 MAG: hypothetical protein JZL65_05620 [Ferrovum myxofaciens]
MRLMISHRALLYHSRRALLWLTVGVVLLCLLAWGGMQWIVLHDVGRFRPQAMALLTNATGNRVEVGRLSAGAFHWMPTLVLDRVVVFTPQNQPGITIKRVQARINVLDFLRGQVNFDHLQIEEPHLTLRRSPEGQMFLSGILLPSPGQGPSPFLEWLTRQGQIHVSGGELVWQDDLRQAPPLRLQNIQLDLSNGGGVHRWEVTVTPPHDLASPLHMEGRVRGMDLGRWSDWQGRVQLDAVRVDWVALLPWVEVLNGVQQARGGLHVVGELTPAHGWDLHSDLDLHPLVWHIPGAEQSLLVNRLQGELTMRWQGGVRAWALHQVRLSGPSFVHWVRPLEVSFHTEGENNQMEASWVDLAVLHPFVKVLPLTPQQQKIWQDLSPSGELEGLRLTWKEGGVLSDSLGFQGTLHHVSVHAWHGLPALQAFSGQITGDARGGQVKGTGLGAQWDLPDLFVAPLKVNSFRVDTQWQRQKDHLTLTIQQLQVSNDDLAGAVEGSLEMGPQGPGQAHLSGSLTHARPDAVWQYLPRMIPPPTRLWLHQALQGGEANPVRFSVAGDLSRFPFVGDQGGTFRVDAQLHDVNLHFDPAWPALTHLDGTLQIRGGELLVLTQSGEVLGTHLGAVQARLPDMTAQNSGLTISGQAQGPVSAGLTFIQRSPLNALLDRALEGWSGKGEGHLILQLEIPLDQPEKTKVLGDYEFLGADLTEGTLGIPPLTRVRGHLLFTEGDLNSRDLTARVLGGAAALAFRTDKRGVLHLKASGQGDWSRLQAVYDEPILKDVTGQEPWQGEFAFGHGGVDAQLQTQGNYLGEPFAFQLSSKPDQGVDLKFVGSTSRKALRRHFSPFWTQGLEGPVNWEGHVRLHDKHVRAEVRGDALWLGGRTTFVAIRGIHHTLRASFAGHIEATALKKWTALAPLEALQGKTDWSGRLEKKENEDPQLWINTSLEGMALNLPQPLQKDAATARPLEIHAQLFGAGREVEGRLGDQLAFQALYRATKTEPEAGETWQLERGRLWLGKAGTHLPLDPGFSVEGAWPLLDLGAWQRYLDRWSQKAGAAPISESKVGHVNVTFGTVSWAGRLWPDVGIDARVEGKQWLIRTRGRSIAGDLIRVQGEPGRLEGHLVHLVIPASSHPDAPAGAENHTPALAAQMPTMDLQVEHLTLPGGLEGHAHLVGTQEGAGVWHLQTLTLVSQETQIQMEGVWQDQPKPQNHYQWDVKTEDLGNFLTGLGYPGLVARGNGEGHGHIQWPGALEDFSLTGVSGHASLNLKDGQFSKVQTGGLGRLISLFSLQTLPRRITLDFNDVFSAGFAFDHLTADLALDHSRLDTRDFEMAGPAAHVKLFGKVDLANETSDLTAQVAPSVEDSVTLASTVVGGPVVGAASWVLQKILGNPFDQALSYAYTIQGPWDDPRIQSVGHP